MRDRLNALWVRAMAALPLGAVQALGALAGWMAFVLPTRERGYAWTNLTLCFRAVDAARRRALVRRSLIESGKTLAEMPGVWTRPPADTVALIREERGREALDRALALGRGLIVAGPHLGNWEIAGLRVQTLGPTTILYRPPRQAGFEGPMRRGRSAGGAQVVPIDATGIRALYRALGRGEIVGILPDQQPRSVAGGVFAPFFGVPAFTMTLLGRLARKSGAPVVYAFAERLPRAGGYRLHWVSAPEGIDDPDPVAAATALNRGVEACVRACPEQYQWGYRRFRLRPYGGPNPYNRPARARRWWMRR
ncbi:MAG: lipid A biosynthesis acyltransferase [Chromatiales bacterium]|jgi:KDO2-lipid IV(A) lauroyltransferase